MSDRGYTDINAATWDAWAEEGSEWTIPVSHQEYAAAQQGEWGVYLTPCIHVPRAWFPVMKDCRVLGLASGGGQQMPIFAALGARCTVFDYSPAQLERERMVAAREGYAIDIVRGDMTQPLPFPDGCFDLIFHPVSNCYIADVQPVWRECFRVLRPGGLLLAAFTHPTVYLFDESDPPRVVERLPYNPLERHSPQELKALEGADGVQFSHSIEAQMGGQLEAGFRLTHLYEDRDREGRGALRAYMPQYIATRAKKPEVGR